MLHAMNYRHAFHAGNHADVLKHIVLLALVDALKRKDTPFFVLDTHAGRGRYLLGGAESRKTSEADEGVFRLLDAPRLPALAEAYLRAVQANNPVGALVAYPGSPLLVAQALREQDRLVACELLPEEAAALKANLGQDPRIAVHQRDGYAAIKALLPPRHAARKFARGLVLIDPPYEAQLDEFDTALAAIREALARWPQGMLALWYPIKQRRVLQGFYRRAAALEAKSALVLVLLVRADDSPLRMNGSGMLLLNAPWQFDTAMRSVLDGLCAALGESGASSRVEWLKAPV